MTLIQFLQEANEAPADFAKRIDVSGETVRRYIAGTRIPDKRIMARLALATGCKVTANDFFGIAA